MILQKLENSTGPIGLYVKFDKEVLLSHDGNDFILLQGSTKFGFTIDAEGDHKQFKLLFNEQTKKIFSDSTISHFIWVIREADTKKDYQGEKSFIYITMDELTLDDCTEEEFEKNETEEISTPPSCSNDIDGENDLEIKVRTNSISLVLNNSLSVGFEEGKLNVIIESYDFNDYADFVTEEYIYTLDDGEFMGSKLNINHQFESNRIHRIFIEYFNQNNIPQSFEKQIEVIIGRPEFYFTTGQYINDTLKSLDLEIELLEDNDMKKMIWKQSRLAYITSGLHINDLTTLDTLEKTLFAEYVTHKILLQKYVTAIYNKYLTGTESNPVAVSTSSMTLGDYTVVDGGGINSMETFKTVANVLNQLEVELKALSNSRGMRKANRTQYHLARNKVLPRYLSPLIELKPGDTIPWSRIDYIMEHRRGYQEGEIIDR